MTSKGKKLMASLGMMLGFLLAIIWVAVIFVVPYFAELVTSMSDGEAELPAVTKVVFNVSAFLQNNGMLLGMFSVLLFAGSLSWRLVLWNAGRQKNDRE